MKQLKAASGVDTKRSRRQLKGTAASPKADSQHLAIEKRTDDEIDEIIDKVLLKPCTAVGAQTPEVADRLLVQVGSALV